MSNLTPIYAHDRKVLNDALAEFRFLLRRDPQAAIPDWLKAHAPLVAEQRAQIATGKFRSCDAPVTLTVVFIDKGGEGQGILGELLMERIDANATGELYPAVTMAGVRTDADWRGAMEAARKYAAVCGFGIIPGSDVRWSVRLLKAGENLELHKSQPLSSGEKLIGGSAGVAFFLGLFALAKADGTRRAVDARKVVEYMIALATFPELGPRTVDDRLGTLGGTEKKKLRALRSLPAGTQVVVIFPRDYPESFLIPHDPLPINTIAELAAVLRQRSAPPTWPDSLPHSRRAPTHYIDSRDEVRRLRESLHSSRIHVVSGPGGVGKTARIVKATDALLQDGVFPGGRFWIELNGADEPRRKAGKVIATYRGFEAKDEFDELRDQTQRLLAKPSLVLLEGAETVPENAIKELLDWFTGPTTVVWMTRRKTDAEHSHLRGAKHHSVDALSPVDALELLCCAAERKVEGLSAAERAELDVIAKTAKYLPLLLGWAGAAMQPDRDTNPDKYLAELKDLLKAIADPNDPDQHAGLFVRLSLTLIVATKEMPTLPALAKRLFAGLAAFHPSYGAPRLWWPLAAGLDASQPEGRKRLAAARRALIGLGLVVAMDSPPSDRASKETLHAVHALAGKVSVELWHEQHAVMRTTVLNSLARAAVHYLAVPPPLDWPTNTQWIANTAAIARHSKHWTAAAGFNPESDSAFELIGAWLRLCELLRHATSEHKLPQLQLLDSAISAADALYTARVPHRAREYSDNKESLLKLVELMKEDIGPRRCSYQDWIGAEQAYGAALTIAEALAQEYPKEPEHLYLVSDLLEKMANVRLAR